MEKPLLTIVIPVYNAVNTLRACVDSILAQAHKIVELILVDDGSAEETAALCDVLSVEYPGSVRVLHQANAGSLKARLAGSALATGEYILFVDADDVLLDGAIARIQADIESGADLYMYDYVMDAVDGSGSNTVRLMDQDQKTEFCGEDKTQVSRAFMKGMMNTVCATAIRRDFLLGLKLQLPEKKIRNGEDRLQKLQMIINARRIVYVPVTIYHYLWYPSSQGSGLRTGRFSAEIYEDMQTVWTVERENYGALGFDADQSAVYDGKKLARVCGLLEAAWNSRKMEGRQLRSLVCKLKEDKLFGELRLSAGGRRQRLHIRLVARLIGGGFVGPLRAYWRLCSLARSLRHKG